MTAEELIASVGKEFGFGLEAICSKDRSPGLDEAKRAACYLVRMHTQLGWIAIASIFRCSYTNPRIKMTSAVKQLRVDHDFAERVRALELKLGLKQTVDDALELQADEVAGYAANNIGAANRDSALGARVSQEIR